MTKSSVFYDNYIKSSFLYLYIKKIMQLSELYFDIYTNQWFFYPYFFSYYILYPFFILYNNFEVKPILYNRLLFLYLVFSYFE